MSGNFKNRHHVEPRVKLHSWREQSSLFHSNILTFPEQHERIWMLKQERRIDDYWDIDGSRDLSDSWKLETPMALGMPCKTSKKCEHGETRGKTIEFKSKLACILEASESTRLRMENHYQIIMKIILQEKVAIHYSITIWYTNLFPCLKQ